MDTGVLESESQPSAKSVSEAPSTTKGTKYDLSQLYEPKDKSIMGTPEQGRIETSEYIKETFKPAAIKKVDQQISQINSDVVNVSNELNSTRKAIADNQKILEDLYNQAQNQNLTTDEHNAIKNEFDRIKSETENVINIEGQVKQKAVNLQKAKSSLNKIYDVQKNLDNELNDDALKVTANMFTHIYNAIPETIAGVGTMVKSVGNVIEPTNPLYDIVGNSIKDAGDDLKGETDAAYDDKHYISSTIGDIVGSVVVAAIPGSAAAKAGKAAQMITGATAATMQMADGVHEKAKEAGLSDRDAGIMTLAIAPLSGLMEVWGASNIIDNVAGKSAIKELIDYTVKNVANKKLTKKLVYETVGEGFKTIGKKFGISAAKSTTEEGLTEGVQAELEAAGESIYDTVKGEKKYGTEFFSSKTQTDVAKQAALGAVAGTAFGVLSGIGTKQSLYNKAKELAEDPKKMAQFQDILNSEIESQNISPEQGAQVLNTVNSIIEMDKTIPPIVENKDERIKAVELISEKNNLTKEAEALKAEVQGYDAAMLEPSDKKIAENKQRIDEINSELKAIASESERVSLNRRELGKKEMVMPSAKPAEAVELSEAEEIPQAGSVGVGGDVESTKKAMAKLEEDNPDLYEDIRNKNTLDNYDIKETVVPDNIESEIFWQEKLVEKALKDAGVDFNKQGSKSTGSTYYTLKTKDGESFKLRVADHKVKYDTDGNIEYNESTTPNEILEQLTNELPDGKILKNTSVVEEYYKQKSYKNITNPELVKAVEQSLKETPKAGSVGVGEDVKVNKKLALQNAEKIDKGNGSHIKNMSMQELKELASDMVTNEKEYKDKFNDAQGIYNLTTERIKELEQSEYEKKESNAKDKGDESMSDNYVSVLSENDFLNEHSERWFGKKTSELSSKQLAEAKKYTKDNFKGEGYYNEEMDDFVGSYEDALRSFWGDKSAAEPSLKEKPKAKEELSGALKEAVAAKPAEVVAKPSKREIAKARLEQRKGLRKDLDALPDLTDKSRADVKALKEGGQIPESDFDNYIADNSESPLELAENFLRLDVESETRGTKLSAKGNAIENSFIKIIPEQWEYYAGENAKKELVNAQKKYISENGSTIDQAIEKINSEYPGINVTRDDIIEHIKRVGYESTLPPKTLSVINKFKAKFSELTNGGNLTRLEAKRLVENNIKEKLKNYEKIIDREFKTAAEAEAAYREAFETGDLAIEGGEVVTTAKSNARPTKIKASEDIKSKFAEAMELEKAIKDETDRGKLRELKRKNAELRKAYPGLAETMNKFASITNKLAELKTKEGESLIKKSEGCP